MALIDKSETYQMTNPGDHIDGTDVYQSNPNLLDNPWFTVRQRGDGPFSGANTEAFDRWLATINSTLTGTANGITITTTVRTWGMQQRVAKGFFTVGKTYTISAMEQDGTITSATFTWTGSGISKYVTGANVGFEISVSNGNYEQIYFTTNYVGSVDLKAVKIELGSVSTLANDTPPDYDRELEHCKYYFERIKALGNYAEFGLGIAQTTGTVYAHIPMHPKRDGNYTIATNGSFRVISTSGISATGISKYAHTSTAGNLVVSVTASVTAGQAYRLTANNDANAYIDINNDL